MASYCPKCGYKLKLKDIKPDCPKCGVNVLYYKMDERLLADADKVEEEHVHFQAKVDRIKASLFGSKLAIMRFVFCFLAIGALFLPLVKVSFSGPYIDRSSTVNLLFLYDFVSKLDFDALFAYMRSPVLGTAFKEYFIAIVTVLLSVLLSIVNLIFVFFSSGKKSKVRNITVDSLAVISAAVSLVMFTKFSKSIINLFPGAYSGKVAFGAFVFLGVAAALVVINVIIAKKGIPVKYKQCYISGFPAEEVFAAREKGITLNEMRAERDAKEAAEAAEKAEEEKKPVAAE
ncbi:MAG: hypothetical protein K5756_05600 [Clostridiales bacterium]|nr:hypothetical protein [Clostridiales bacterium]